MNNDPERAADADYVLRWVYQAGPDKVPSDIYDLAARALDLPSLAHGMAPAAEETIGVECTEENPCCERANQYNGFASGPLFFTCPKSCSCHD